jgi:flavodoxin
MKSLVIYDSKFGNTKKVAERIGEVLSKYGRVIVIKAVNVQAGDVSGLNLLIVGSPTQQFSATKEIKRWLHRLPNNCLQGVRAAAFDTRFTQEKIDEIKILAFFVSIFGFAATKIAQRLEKRGAKLTAPPEGFYVLDTEGPLVEEELQRAAEWAEKLVSG